MRKLIVPFPGALGLQDTNLARVRTTQEYIMNCDNIFIVARIARAITDQSIRSSLYTILSQHMSREWENVGGRNINLAIVCTKSEVCRLRLFGVPFLIHSTTKCEVYAHF